MDFTVRAKKWNSDVFANVFMRKKRVLARINGIKKPLPTIQKSF